MDDLERALSSADPEERRRAVSEIGAVSESDRARLIVGALGDPDWRVRKEAVVLARALTSSREVLDALIDVLRPGDNVGLRNAAVEALSAFGSAAVEALRSALPTLDDDGRKLAAEALAGSGDSAALGVLETLLDDEDPNVRTAAIDAIAVAGRADVDQAMSLLERCLVTDETLTVLAALEGLNRLGCGVAWAMLRPHLKDPVLHDAAITAAGLSGHVDAAPYLVNALMRGRGRSFQTALSAMATYVANEPIARRSARAAMSSLDDVTRRKLIEEAKNIGDDLERLRSALIVIGLIGTPEAADVVIAALADDRLAAEAEQALGMLGPAAILALARHARTGVPEERAACVVELGQLADDSTRAVACRAILDATEDGAPDVVRAALVALAQIGDEGTLGLAARWLVPDAPSPIRHAAASALSASAARHPDAARALSRQVAADSPSAAAAAIIIGALDEPVFGSVADDVAFLAEAASNASPIVRRAALESLSRFGNAAAVEAVSFALTDEIPEVQLAAIRSLGRMRDDAGHAPGVSHLLDVSGTLQDEALGVAAVEALGATGDPAALDTLRSVAREGSAIRAVAAVEALGRINAPERIDALIHALSHSEPEVVKAALRTVALEEKDPRAAAHLAAALDHEAWDVRRLAAELLGRRADSASKHLLRQRLIVEREPLVHAEIQRSLADPDTTPVRRTLPPLGGGGMGGEGMV